MRWPSSRQRTSKTITIAKDATKKQPCLPKHKQNIMDDLKAAKKAMAKAKFRLINSKSKGNNEVAHQGRLLFVDTLAFGF